MRLVVIAVSLGAAAASCASELVDRVERVLVEEQLVGATWALVTPTGVTTGAAGWNDAPAQRRMMETDRVQTGSVAKSVLAVGVLRLVTEGRIDLDAPVERYLPALHVDNPWDAEAPLRIRHLLDHTGGLDDARLSMIFSVQANPDAPLLEALGGERATVVVRHRPGERPSYSNIGYLLLGSVIEAVTQQRYEDWLNVQVLAPLGMARSTVSFVTQEGPRGDRTLAQGHFDLQETSATLPSHLRPATQFTTTAADMARFLRFLMGDGRVDGQRIVDAGLLRAMGVPTTSDAARAGLPIGFALGLVRRDRHGLSGRCHLGNSGTFRAALCVYPDQQRGFFIAFNADPEGGAFERIDAVLVQALGLRPGPPMPSSPPAFDPQAWSGWYLLEPNRFEQFRYLDAVAGAMRVDGDGRIVAMRPLQGEPRDLLPVGGGLFRATDRSEASHAFIRSADGEVVISDGLRSWVRQDAGSMSLRWAGALLGVIGFLHVMLVGGARCLLAWRRGTLDSEPMRWPGAAIAMLVLSPLLFLRESVLALGDPTLASVVLTATSALLPFAVLGGVVHRWRSGLRSLGARWDFAMLLGLLQWCLTLAFNGWMPVMLWR